MKRLLLTLAMTAALSSSAFAERIGVAMSNFDDNFLTVVRNAMANYAMTQPGLDMQFEDAQLDVGKQLSQIQNFIASKVDAIIVNPVDTDATPKMTALAVEAGIPLVYVNRMPADKTLPPKIAFVGSNEKDSGTLEMKEVCRLMNGKGKILVMMGDLANQAARQRTEDVETVIKTPECQGISILEKQVGAWMRVQGNDLVQNWLSAGLKPDAIVANNDEMAIGAVQALKAAGVSMGVGPGKVIVAGIDATQDGLQTMKQGNLAVTVFQNANGQGEGAVKAAQKLVKGEKVDSYVWIPFELVTPANMAKYQTMN